MTKLSNKQKTDLQTIMFFIPEIWKNRKINNKDIEIFFKFSDKGIKPQKKTEGYEVLCEGKRWRGIHIHEMWEEGIIRGDISYWVLLGGYSFKELLPRSVVDFMKGEIFKGIDAEIIEKVYQELLHKYRWQLRLRKIINFFKKK